MTPQHGPVLKLLLIRHAESVGNQLGQMEGHGETPLSARGIQQAERLAERLLSEFERPTWIYTSPLKRATETLATVLHRCPDPLSVTAVDDLREFQNGIFQGLTWAEAIARYPDLCRQLECSQDWRPIPGAESLEAGRDRARRFIQSVLNRHGNGDRIWVMTHSWILYHLVAELMGCERSWKFPIQHTALFEFWLDRSRWEQPGHARLNTELWQIQRFNDAQMIQGARTN